MWVKVVLWRRSQLPAPSVPLWAPVPPWTIGHRGALGQSRKTRVLCSAHQCHCRKTDVRDDEMDLGMLLFPSVAVCEHMLGPHVMQTAMFIVSTCIFKTMQKENPWFLFNCSLFSVVVFTVSSDWNNWAWLICLDTRLRIMKSIMKSTTVWSDAECCKCFWLQF